MDWALAAKKQADSQIDEARLKVHLDKRPISDIVDDAGHQYVDLVMEGGGMWGIALVGYTYALEQLGIRFRGIGGASAGAINALAMAAAAPPEKTKSDAVLDILKDKDIYDFVDGGDRVHRLIKVALKKDANFKTMRMLYHGLFLYRRLSKKYGLNPGDSFLAWFDKIMDDFGAQKVRELDQKLKPPPSLKLRPDSGGSALRDQTPLFRISIVTSDISTETKVDLPEMLGLYAENPLEVNSAVLARMSMAVPGFFAPHSVANAPRGPDYDAQWETCGYATEDQGGYPKIHHLVDGGMTSNFPIDTFHTNVYVPQAPTFGVKLGIDERRRDINGLVDWAKALLSTSRHTLDYTYIQRNPDYTLIVRQIPIPDMIDWLDFDLGDAKKGTLFMLGVQEAIGFIEHFDWESYKKLRSNLLMKSESQSDVI